MKFIRILVLIVFVLVVGAWSVNVVLDKTVRDHTPPVITSDRDLLELSVKDDKSKLVSGLKATDDRDGDLTSEILVGSHSKFISEGVCDITYLVFDSSNNVGKYTRRVKYTDYTEPVFTLKEPLMFNSGDTVSMFSKISLTDCLDGDISSKVKIVVNDVDNSKLGTYYVTFEASNSYADVVIRSTLLTTLLTLPSLSLRITLYISMSTTPSSLANSLNPSQINMTKKRI